VSAAPAPDQEAKANGPRARRRAESRAKILRAAKEVFEEKGFLAVRVSEPRAVAHARVSSASTT
jgi:DNA-binding transcriptional regulator YbjK